MNGQRREADHSPSSKHEVRNYCGFTTTVPHGTTSCRETLHLPLIFKQICGTAQMIGVRHE